MIIVKAAELCSRMWICVNARCSRGCNLIHVCVLYMETNIWLLLYMECNMAAGRNRLTMKFRLVVAAVVLIPLGEWIKNWIFTFYLAGPFIFLTGVP